MNDQNLLKGLLLAAVALAFGLGALRYPIGDFSRAGPGLFPLVISGILLVIAIASIIRSRFVQRVPVDFSIRNIGEKLEESETLLNNVFRRIPVGIAAGSSFGNFSVINPTFEKIIGWTKEQLKECDWEKITHPDDLEEDLAFFKKFKSGEIAGYSMEKRFLKPDGSYVWVDMTIAGLNLSGKENQDHL